MEYAFSLEKYNGPKSRHTCPQCDARREFARYVDAEGNYIADHVGRCNREDKCGYHMTPSQYFSDNPVALKTQFKRRSITPRVTPSFIPYKLLKDSRRAYQKNNFAQFLLSVFDSKTVSELIGLFHIGTSNRWPGATIFWQIDNEGKIRSGKIMLYKSGHRTNKTDWVHSKMDGFNLCQCLFGLHQVIERPYDPIAICESEKTAIIATAYLPEYVWMATGGKTNGVDEKCQVVKGKRVTLFPDLGAFDKWKNIGDLMGFATSDLLERHASMKERSEGLDLADFLLRYSPTDFKERRAQLFREKWTVQSNEYNVVAMRHSEVDRLEPQEQDSGPTSTVHISADCLLNKPLFMPSLTVDRMRDNGWRLPACNTQADYEAYQSLRKHKRHEILQP